MFDFVGIMNLWLIFEAVIKAIGTIIWLGNYLLFCYTSTGTLNNQ